MSPCIHKYLLMLALASVMSPVWGQTDTLCLADSVGNYHVIGQDGSSFLWDTQGDGEIIAGQGNDSVRIAWIRGPGNYLLQVVETNAEGCRGDPMLLNIVLVDCRCDVLAEVTRDTSICLNEYVELTASGGASYLWSTGDTSSSITVAPIGDSLFVVVVSTGSCADTAEVNVEVHPLPEIFAGNDTTIIFGQNGNLKATVEGNILWQPGIYLECQDCKETIIAPLATTTYCINTSNEFGCEASDCVTITVDTLCDGLFIPNVFSPAKGGHQENDCFRLYGTDCIGTMTLSVYNRWGEKVFQTLDPAGCWDGTFRGETLNAGVFVYQLEAILITGESLTRQGNITMIR